MNTFRRRGNRVQWALPCALLLVLGSPARAEKSPTPETAMERLGQGDAVGARRDYEALLSKRPDDPRLAFNAGLAAYRHQDWEGAARHFESALGSSDLQLQQRAFLALGNSRSRQGEMAEEVADKTRLWEDAVQQYQAALGLNPADTDARFNLEAVQEQLSRLPKPEQDPKDQKDSKNQKDSKDQKSQDQEQNGQDEKKPEDGKSQDQKSKEGQDGKQQEPKDSKQQGMGGQDSKKEPAAGKDKKPDKGQPGDPDGKDQKEQQQSGKDGKDAKDGQQGKESKRGEKGEDGKEGQSGEAGEEGQGRPGQPGTAGRGQPGRDAGEDSVDGRMAVRFAERLLDGHKQEEKALIWRPATQAREPQRGADGRRKTW